MKQDNLYNRIKVLQFLKKQFQYYGVDEITMIKLDKDLERAISRYNRNSTQIKRKRICKNKDCIYYNRIRDTKNYKCPKCGEYLVEFHLPPSKNTFFGVGKQKIKNIVYNYEIQNKENPLLP